MVFCIVGSVLAVFVPTFMDRVRVSKVSEATDALATMHRLTAAYYARDACLPTSAGPTPTVPTEEPTLVTFSRAANGGATWSAIAFEPEDPVRFSYSLITPVTTPPRACNVVATNGEPLVTYRAEGDLDGDGEHSRFELTATSTRASSGNTLTLIGPLRVHARIE